MSDSPSSDLLHELYNPERFRELGHELIDQLADYLQKAISGSPMPVLPPTLPSKEWEFWKDHNTDQKDSMKEFFQGIIERSIHVHHPKYMGHQVAVPAPLTALTSMISALLNNGMAVYEMGPVSSSLDRLVVSLVNQIIGYGPDSGGILTSGGTLANLTALLAARSIKAKDEVWKKGTQKQYTILVSEQAHYCVDRAVRIMGWGDEGIILVPTDEDFRMKTELLPGLIDTAQKEGKEVLAIVGSACTTSTGSYDPLEEIAKLCEAYDLWFHVDGAHGAGAAFSGKYQHLVKGIEKADSITLDFHKMLMTPAITTGLLFQKAHDSYHTFAQKAEYLWSTQDDAEWYNYAKRTFECTKRMMSISVFALFYAYGEKAFDAYVSSTYDNARKFAEMVRKQDDLELAIEPESNIVCFRYVNGNLSDEDINQLNLHIRQRILEKAEFYIVQTNIRGKWFLRLTLMNPFTGEEDFGLLINEVRRLASEDLQAIL